MVSLILFREKKGAGKPPVPDGEKEDKALKERRASIPSFRHLRLIKEGTSEGVCKGKLFIHRKSSEVRTDLI